MNKKIKILFLISFLISLNLTAQNKNGEIITVPLSEPEEHGHLVVKHHKGNIDVSGYNGDVVIINASLRYQEKNSSISNQNGMKQISSSVIQLSATEKNNKVVISTNSMAHTIDLTIQVPFKFSLNLVNQVDGKITASNLAGEIEITNQNGSIFLSDISGHALLNTIDGNITASFANVTLGEPMAFTTIDGKLDITFPANSKFTAKMSSELGEIFSDFDMVVEPRQTKTENSKRTGAKKIFLDKWTYGKVNGGGPEFIFKSLDGNIYIRRTD